MSLGRRLLDAGVIDIAQLERGMVRVGDVEHLGRLFDRDPSVDRDAVVVVAETSTEELISDLANRAIITVRVTAYRHHPSGVHRWFVAPLDPAPLSGPISAVSQLDTTVVDDLPGLPFADADELTIEWDDDIGGADQTALIDEFDVSLLEVLSEPGIDESPELDAEVFELSLDLAEFTDDTDEMIDEVLSDEMIDEIVSDEILADEMIDETLADEIVSDEVIESQPMAEFDLAAIEAEADAEPETDLAEFEFSVVWPDGSEELATDGTDYVDESLDAAPTDVDSSDDAIDEVVDEAEPSFSQSDDGDLHFEMPPLALSDEPELADAEVPDDVAEAVRRAIAAIESASVATPEVAPQTEIAIEPDVTTQLPEIADVAVIEETDTIEVAESATPEAPAAELGGFAPPTMATRAEVLYGQMTDDDVVAPTLAESSPTGGVASVVFVDEPVEGGSGGNERSSALSRLIGSLRRKDH